MTGLFKFLLEIPGYPKIQEDRNQDPEEEEQIGKPRQPKSNMHISREIGPPVGWDNEYSSSPY
ncbi:MAG: hypothetical protein VST70_03000 [Nitrospirota bacterium]|nr:hypothetical protein [Nitrospirota bacterium]